MSDCCHCCGEPNQQTIDEKPPKRFRPVAMLLNFVLAYILLVGGGGTLINTGHPVAVEAGRMVQTITFVKPTIHWAENSNHRGIAHGLRVLSNGLPVGQLM